MMLNNFLSAIVNSISGLLGLLVGKISWSTPPWMHYLGAKASARPQACKKVGMMTVALLLVFGYGYYWLTSRPQPELVTAQVITPKITVNDNTLIPDVLIFNFGVMTNNEFLPRSVAPLDQVGKEVSKDFTVTPAVSGKWQWLTDNQLVFYPTSDWPAGQTYTVSFAKPFFTKGAQMEKWSYTFSTLPFTAKLHTFKFYMDPVNPRIRQAVAEVNFDFPVDTKSFENSIAFAWQNFKPTDVGGNFDYTVKYDDNKRVAYIRTNSMSLPDVERYLTLTLSKGIKPLLGPAKTAKPVTGKVLIPDAASIFKVANAGSMIIRNPQDKPEQILTIESSLGVKQSELDKGLHVYVLPKDYPATMAEVAKEDYEWQNPGEVTPAILAEAKPLIMSAMPADRDYATLHSYRYNQSTPTYLYVKVDAGMVGFGDFRLQAPYQAIIKVPEYPKEISIQHKGALLALGTEEKLPVMVRGIAAVKFSIARILPDDINHLITQTNGDYSNPYFENYSFNQDNISEVDSHIQQFDVSDQAQAQYTALDLSKFASSNSQTAGRLGLFMVNAQAWDAKNNLPLDTQTKRLILITDLGLIVKDNNDNTHDVFVQSIISGTPVANIAVSILGKNGVPLFTRTTDSQGRVSFPALNDFTNEREPTVYVARNNNDVSFIPYNRVDRKLNFSRFDIGGVSTPTASQAALTAYIFSDRGIYRPGDLAHFGLIVKQPYVMPQAAGLPLEVIITDPRGNTLKTEKVALNDSGFLSMDFQTTPTSITGQYSINLYIVKDGHPSSLIGSATMTVAEFLPDRMRITANLSDKKTRGWVSPVGLTEKVSLENLYGAPAADHRIGGKLVLAPKAVSFPEFADYIFLDPLLNPKSPPKVFTDTLVETHTDAKGEAVLDLKLDRFEKATYQLTVYAEGFEAEGGRSVTSQTTTLVSPLEFLVGYKADGDLSFIKQNDVRHVNVISINSNLQQQPLNKLKLQLFSLRPVTTLVKRDDGSYEYQSVIQTSLMKNADLDISDKGYDYTIPSDQIGDFMVVVADANETELAKFKFSVVGASQQPLPKNAELSVKLNKAQYAPGEDIEMQVTAPYVGAGLITIERDKVYASQWFKTSTTSSMQTIHIPADFKGNGYVNIAFVRDINSSEIYMSPLSYSVIPFTVTHDNSVVKIELGVPVMVRPGEVLPITYQTDKPGKIIVFAVDEGILQVTRYATPDPLAFFFQKYALEVNTSQIVDQILPKFVADRDLSTVGGDDGASMLNRNLNPFKRKTDAPVVYWSGILDTDAEQHQLTYQVPDYFNGSIKVMAVAVATDAVGSASQTTKVRGDFVINPNVPTFVAPGDEFEVSTSVANNVENSGDKATVNVQLTVTPQLSIVGSATQAVTIPEGKERSVKFKVHANAVLGSADLKLVAGMNGKTSQLVSTLSVRPAIAYATTVTSGYSTDKQKSVKVDRVLYPEFRSVNAVASSSPLILMTGLQRYLDAYPYGCVEQLISKAFPWLAISSQPWLAAETQSAQDKIQKTVQMLSQRQTSSGSFSYWPEVGVARNDEFASIYAMHFLTEAKLQGVSIPADMYSAGIGYLKDFVKQEVETLDQARLQAYAIYILTRNEIVTTNYLTNLLLVLDQHKDMEWKHDITSAYMAATFQLLQSHADAEKMIGYYQPHNSKSSAMNDFYDAELGDAQYLNLVARHFPDKLSSVGPPILLTLVNALNENAMSTILSGYTTLALTAYNQGASSASEYQNNEIAASSKEALLKNPSDKGFFYQLLQSGFDSTLPTSVVNKGIEVTREFTHTDNSSVSGVKLGEEVVVHLRVRATDSLYHANVALVDLLPGGFEVVRLSVNSENMDYVDMREDRVIFFGSVDANAKELTYRIKATNVGSYMVPPMMAASMYDPAIRSSGISGKVSVLKSSH
jgi:uncharacterized protein YfaS (alpha-2-macroglobulin family)